MLKVLANKFRTQSPTVLGIASAIAAAIVFGAHTPAERGVFASGGNVALVLVVTTWARALSLLAYSAATRQKLFPSYEDAKQAAIGGACQAITVLCIFTALVHLSAPVVIIIVFSHTLMLLFFMAWRKEIKLDALTLVTTSAALAGLSLVIDLWHQQTAASWYGIGLSFVAALATVSRLYVYGLQTKERNPAAVGAENFLFAAPLASLILLVSPAHFPALPVGYLWLGVASASLALGTFFLFYGISFLGSFRYSLFSKLEPIFTSLFSVLFLGEVLKFQQYMGIVVVVCSLALYQIFGQRRIKTS